MRLLVASTVLMVATASTAHGQAVDSCPRPGETVQVFDTERREPFSGVLTTIPPSFALFPLLGNPVGNPPVFVGGLLDETLEVRERLVYDRHDKVIRLTTFIIQGNANFKTEADLGSAPSCADVTLDDMAPDPTLVGTPCIVERATLFVKQIVFSCTPVPSVLWVGTMRQDFPPPPVDPSNPGGWGVDVTGATFAFSTGYTTNAFPDAPTFNLTGADPRFYDCSDGLFNLTESVAGVGVAWAPCGAGTLDFGHGQSPVSQRKPKPNLIPGF